jgi:mannitol-specific phosphotransferase system IIBC component
VDAVEQQLLRWMNQNELLTLQRQQPGRITWEPLRGVHGAIRRSTSVLQGNRPFMLTRAGLVSAMVTALEPGFCHVTLAAELIHARGGAIGGAAAMGAVAVAAGAVLAVMSPFALLALAPAPFLLAAGWAILRQYRSVAARTQLGLERALDHLERGEVKPGHALSPGTGVVGAILEEVRKALNP